MTFGGKRSETERYVISNRTATRKLRAVSITEDKKRVQRNCALYFLTTQGRAARMARVAGFEPANDGVRIRCLTAWRYPNVIAF